MNTLALDRDTWDLTLDVSGDIALATNPYALAQDAASGARLFRGECWYDTTRGIPQAAALGGQVNIAALRQAYVAAALAVPDVTVATCVIGVDASRTLRGQITVTDATGAQASTLT